MNKRLTKTIRTFCNIFIIPVFFLFTTNSVIGQSNILPMVGKMAGQVESPKNSDDTGLLFYLSGEHEFEADFAAGGQNNPNFLKDVKIITDGAEGKAFETDDTQLMSYWAPGNIYAQRGTLSFFWRSRYAVGPTPFPVFRVAFADNTSWDMAWLRIDYNGAGIDAFVTDIGLSRTRVSWYTNKFPASDEWTHIAFSWDETEGIRLYINGKLVKRISQSGKVFDTGLDQFGPHSRIISPYQVQSAFSFMRGGDLDELRIYDRMLSDENVAELFQNKTPKIIPSITRDLNDEKWRDEWWDRNGWNLPNDPPSVLPSEKSIIRKVEIHEATDVKRWFWKANDGIRETTWPGVYNMSRIEGRYDYFVLPDWDCYSMSGQTIKFQIPEEPWNHVEIWGKAWGQLTLEKQYKYDNTFAVRSRNQVKSFHRLNKTETSGTLRFDNALIEEPIGELGVYNIQPGTAPKGDFEETFFLNPLSENQLDYQVKSVEAFIRGRYPKDEQTMMAGSLQKNIQVKSTTNNSIPFVHIIIPYGIHLQYGLDGIEIELPPLTVQSTHGNLYPLNIRIKDPLWQMRDLADFSFSVLPNKAQTLWIDTRDRVLPDSSAIYITIAGAGYGLNAESLSNAKIRLVYKSKDEAIEEQVIDRVTQLRDLYGFMVEERMVDSRLNLYNRFMADYSDIIKVDPYNFLARAYRFAYTRNRKFRPEYKLPQNTENVPEWAFLQGEYMQLIANIVNYYIDERQIGTGEFGGGLSDDDDFTNILAGAAMIGIEPEKIQKSMQLFIKGYYDQDRSPYDAGLKQRSLTLFTNGLATITTDLLHAYEEGIQAVGQMMLLDYGNPRYINRGMETAKSVMDKVTAIAPDGHRHFRSRLYGGTSIATEDPWQWSGAYSYNVLHTAYFIQQYNKNPEVQKLLVELADGLLAHQDKDGNIYTEINFSSGEVRGKIGVQGTWQIFYAAYVATGNQKYLEPIRDRINQHNEFNPEQVEFRYKENIRNLGVQEFINTDGSIWIDRVTAYFNDLQSDRLGGVVISRIHNIYPQNFISWEMQKPASFKSLATFVLKADSTKLDILVYNLEKVVADANLTLWKIKNGKWRIRQGIDTDDDRIADSELTETTVTVEKGNNMEFRFQPRRNTILHLELIEESEKNNRNLPDLAISSDFFSINKNEVTVRVFSQGAVGSPETKVELQDSMGKTIATSIVPALEAPLDLIPKWVEVKLKIPDGIDLSHGKIQVDPKNEVEQITRRNTMIAW